ncbi:surface lipoprotein assembly modifier [Neisseria montereyensis]|uniref:Surface lipoprotein assembly modifier n=1 Tax=Neisseria montereyensis TaxID=2973938 RepID=A0ABT2FEH6_9NEIS|nr:surface lipoprotein assembly modifier [Neisseria montereyensis]MCS4534621.1 surface lipoprotein assembly modifier [Neisseria montereyensis]
MFFPFKNLKYTTTFFLTLLCCAAPLQAAETVVPQQRPERPEPKLPEIQQPEQSRWQPAVTSETEIQDIDEKTLLQQPNLLNLLLDKSVMANDLEGIKVLLPVYRKLPDTQRDDTLLLLAESKLAMFEGNFSQAVDLLRQIIAERPDLDVIRMYLAIALFYDQQDVAAQDQFDKLLAQAELPEQEKAVIEQFTEQLQQRHRWQFNGGINYAREPNINNAPIVREQGNINTDIEPEKATGIVYHFGAEKDWALPRGFLLKSSLDISGKYYPGNQRYNDLLADVGFGVGYRNARFDVALMPFVTKRWWQGYSESSGQSGLQSYSDSFGATLSVQSRLSRRWRSYHYARIEKTHHEERFRFDGIRRQIGQTLIYQASPQQAWFGGIDYQQEKLHDTDNSNHLLTGSLGWIQEWPKGFSTRSRIAWGKQKYHAPMPWPILKTRQDNSLQMQVSVWHRNIHFWGITPRLTWQRIRNKSNVFLYDYQKNNVFLEFSKQF